VNTCGASREREREREIWDNELSRYNSRETCGSTELRERRISRAPNIRQIFTRDCSTKVCLQKDRAFVKFRGTVPWDFLACFLPVWMHLDQNVNRF
jgi:hypothetical protein